MARDVMAFPVRQGVNPVAPGFVRIIVRTKKPPSGAVLSAQAFGRQVAALDAVASAGFNTEILTATGAVIHHVYQTVPGFAVDVPAGEVERLRDSQGAENVESDSEYHTLMDLGAPAVGAPLAWNTGCDGSGVVVAILDTGIDSHHPDFQGRVDLSNSQNFTNEQAPSDVMDRNGHGTHVAGILAGSGQASNGLYQGVARRATILALKVFDSEGRGTGSGIAAAVEWAIQHGAEIINFSGGKHVYLQTPWVWPSQQDFVESYFNAAVVRGIPCAVAAGNFGTLNPPEGTVTMPGVAEHVITVGSLRRAQRPSQLSSFSSRGQAHRSDAVSRGSVKSYSTLPQEAGTVKVWKPDVVAPGGENNDGSCQHADGVVSTRPIHNQVSQSIQACTLSSNPKYAQLSGTSMATPIVAGICALIAHKLKTDGIQLGPQQGIVVKNLIKRHAVDLHLARELQGSGIVNWRAINIALDEIKQHPHLVAQYEIPDL